MRFALLGFGLLTGLVAIVVLATINFTVVPFAEKPPSPLTTSTVEEPALPSGNTSKLGTSLRLRLSTPSKEAEQVNILLRTNGTLTPEQRTQLETLGAEVRTIAGDIVTAVVVLQQVPTLSELAFVRYIELSQALHPESP